MYVVVLLLYAELVIYYVYRVVHYIVVYIVKSPLSLFFMIYGRFIIGDSISVSRGSQIKSPFHGQITQKTPSISYYDKMEQKNCFQASRARNAVEKKTLKFCQKHQHQSEVRHRVCLRILLLRHMSALTCFIYTPLSLTQAYLYIFWQLKKSCHSQPGLSYAYLQIFSLIIFSGAGEKLWAVGIVKVS